jgi:hypothetical protein
MKAKVIIENGLSTIVLTPDNDFEKQVVENAYDHKHRFEIITDVEVVKNTFTQELQGHTINIKLKKLD